MKNTVWKQAWSLLLSAVLAGELAVVLDVLVVLNGSALSVVKFGALFLGLFAVIHLIPFVRKKIRNAGVMVMTSAAVVLLICIVCWKSVSDSVVYDGADTGKTGLYGGQRVLLLVPHQDDDINVLGGVIEEYVKYGSDVRVVFSTNGDYYGLQEIRFQEAIDALGAMGVPKENVIFLGYGDTWAEGGPHLYNAGTGMVMTSFHGSQETYGTSVKEVWREGAEYTIDNFLLDIESVILEYRPDVIYCVDYDYNLDHKALSLSFEKVMGKILKETDYRPLVFKGYAYNSAWEAVVDFYADNLLPTHNVYDPGYPWSPRVYHWQERVRLPIHAEALSRSVISTRIHKALALYDSQNADLYSPRIINSDKVFWQRHTNSLAIWAKVQVSSGNGALLNDFMLIECNDIVGERRPYDGAWIPEEDDSEKQATLIFDQPEDIHSIVLYDNPAEDSNVRNVRIEFSDGSALETGALDPLGAANRIEVDKTGITALTVTILEGEGSAGLTEIEIFGDDRRETLKYVKIMDEEGNFVYDYWMDPSGAQSFRLFTSGVEDPAVTVSCDNDHCSAVWQEGELLVECPVGERCTITVDAGNGVSDSVVIRNPGMLQRKWIRFWLDCEEKVMELRETKLIHKRIFLWRMAEKIPVVLESLIK